MQTMTNRTLFMTMAALIAGILLGIASPMAM
jgi:hypothetical protein